MSESKAETPETQDPSPKASAPKDSSRLITLLASIIALLVGFGGGYLVGQATAPRTQAAEPSTSAPAEATTPAEATAQPTISEEDMQRIIEARRAVPRRDANDPLAVGDVDAPVVLVEFFDYQCSYCGKFAIETQPQLMELVENGTLRMEFRDFPIFGDTSVAAAVAAKAAATQGLYLEYHEALFTHQFVDGKPLTPDALVEIATQVGIPDMDAFQAALADPALTAEVQASGQEAMQILGSGSTPQFVINDEYIGGAAPAEQFLSVIDAELAKTQ